MDQPVPMPVPRPEGLATHSPVVTPQRLKAITRYARTSIIVPLADALNQELPASGLLDGPLRLPHFLGQSALETDHFKTLMEYASGAAYEGRRDLGNIYRGDGVRFKGRGIFQCTGRANYARYGKMLGLDLLNHPELAADPLVSVRIAILYWNDHHLSVYADRDDCLTISKRINGVNRRTGLPNHYPERLALTQAAKRAFGVAT